MSLNVAGPDLVVPRLAEFLIAAYAALEVGVAVARAFFARAGRQPDAWLFADIVRNEAKHQLALQYEMEELPNNGLLTVTTDCAVRIRHGDDGEVPVPGHSRAMQDFYEQLPLFGLSFQSGPNLVLLWETDHEWNLSDTLLLVAPKGGDDSWSSVDYHWRVEVVERGTKSAFHGQRRPMVEDLDIRLPGQTKTGSEDPG